jgi:hypothetical protein
MDFERSVQITSSLSRRRAGALAGLLGALAAYGALAADLPGLPSRLDLAVVALLILPASLAVAWLALPLARVRALPLAGAAVAVGAIALVLELADVDSVANVAKLGCFVLVGLWFVSFFEEAWWVGLVAVLVPWVDVWSVAVGPTRYVVDEQPGFFEEISVGFAVPGELSTVNLGPPDAIFFSLFLAAALLYGLRPGWTWLAMTGLLSLTLVVIWEWEIAGLPALPAVCLGFLVPNADRLWRDFQEARAARRSEAPTDT